MIKPRPIKTVHAPGIAPTRAPLIGLFLLAGSLLLPCTSFSAATNNPPNGNRYLIIVETSKAMQSRSDGVIKALQQLLASGFDGQTRRGDTLGVWTFNNQLHAGAFPLQQCSPELQTSVGETVVSFLQTQHYEKSANLQVLAAALDQVIRGSKVLTIILVTGGDQKLYWTPFDSQINQMFEMWRKQQDAAHMPFLTILRCNNGRMTDFRVNPAPWQVEMPPLPPEPKIVEPPEQKTAPVAAKPPPPSLPPVIISGRKTRSPELANVSNAIVFEPKSAIPESAGVSANPATATNVIAAPSPGPAPTPQPGSAPPAAPAPKETPSTINPATQSTPANPPGSSTAPPVNPPSSSTGVAPPPIAAPREENKPITAESATEPVTTLPAPTVAHDAAAAPSATPAPAPENGNKPVLQPQRAVSAPNAGAGPAVAVSSQPVLGKRFLWVGGGAAVAAIALVLVWWNRSRSARHISLITRSMNRDKPS